MQRPEVDICILGGGCAGLSLAQRLAAGGGERARSLRVLVLERRGRDEADRSWSFWQVHDHPFANQIAHHWVRWRVAHAGQGIVQGSRRHPYVLLTERSFQERARACIGAAAGIAVKTGVTVRSVEPLSDQCLRVETSHGAISARWVLDGRPPSPLPALAPPGLYRSILGWEVETEQDAFDPATVDLMDFQVGDPAAGPHFLHVLPFTARRALVESVLLLPRPVPGAEHETLLWQAMARRVGPRWTVRRTQQGCLPLDPRLTLPAARGGAGPGRLIPIGIPGGAVRPGTGHAFLRIQRWADSCAAEILAGRPPVPMRHSPLLHRLDSLFLHALAADPALLPGWQMQQFTQVPPPALIRWLSDRPTPLDLVRVLAASPRRALLRALLHRGRRAASAGTGRRPG